MLPIYRTFGQQSSFFRSPVPNREHTCMCQAMTTVREPFSPQFPFLQRIRSAVKGASLAMLEVDKPCIWETLQTCCEEDCFVADAAVLRLPGILLLPGITLPSIEVLQCWKKSICPSSMSWQRNCEPIQIATIHSTEERAGMQVSARNNCHISPQFPFLQTVRSRNSFSLAMLKTVES